MTDDLTARARLRDAAIALIAAGEKPTARSVAARANVSIGLIRHHFGTMDGLLLTCDEHVATLIRNAKNDAIRGPIPNVLEVLRETGQDNVLGYLAHRLTDSSTAIDALVDQLADDAADYMRRAIDADLLTPVPNVAAAARMLTIYSLGSLVLGRHLKRLLDVDIAAEDIAAEPGVRDYVQVQLTLFASLFTPHATPAGGATRKKGERAMNAIEVKELRKKYGSFEALKGIDLKVRTGEIFGFLGPNGAGKSTTIRILLDEIRATGGTARLLGLDSRCDAVEIHRRLGYLPSDLSLYPAMTGAQTLRFFARLRGGVDQDYIDELRQRFDANLDKRVGELSSGNRQKVGLIAALMHKPELIIMDEPNAGLDPLVQHEFHQVLREIVAEGRTVFLSSHTLSEVQQVADRVGIIRAGRLVAVENVADLRSVRRVDLLLDRDADPGDFIDISGARDVTVDGPRVRMAFDGELGTLLDALGDHRVVDLTAHDADLEEIFLAFYQEQS